MLIITTDTQLIPKSTLDIYVTLYSDQFGKETDAYGIISTQTPDSTGYKLIETESLAVKLNLQMGAKSFR